MSEMLPGFSVTQDPDRPDGVVIGLVLEEWEHVEDHDAVLMSMYPLVLGELDQLLNERTLDKVRGIIAGALHRMRALEEIYRGPRADGVYRGHGLGKWVLDTAERKRHAARRDAALAARYKDEE